MSDIIIFIDTLVNYKTMPKTKEQFEQIRQERMNTILRSALNLFVMKGYNAFSLDEITKDAKCSHGLLYHYFHSKEELYEAVLNQIVYPSTIRIVENVNFDQKAIFVIHDLLDTTLKVIKSPNDERVKELYLLLNIHLQKSLPIIKKNEKGHTQIFATVEDLIERGKREGDINDYTTVELTIAILSMIKGLAFNRVHIGYKRFVCPHSEVIMEMLLR